MICKKKIDNKADLKKRSFSSTLLEGIVSLNLVSFFLYYWSVIKEGTSLSEVYKYYTYVSLFCVFIFIGISVYSILELIWKTKKEKLHFAENPITYTLITGFLNFTLVETCIQGCVFKNIVFILMGYVLSLFPFLIGAIIFKSPKIWNISFSIMYAIYGLIQYFVQMFRGAPARFSDLHNIDDAIAVIGEYKIRFDAVFFIVTIQLILIIYYHYKVQISKMPLNIRPIIAVSTSIIVVAFIAMTNYSYQWGIKNKKIVMNYSLSQDKASSGVVGNMLSFYYDAVFNRLTKPNNYSAEKAKTILENNSIQINTKENNTKDLNNAPVLIAILNESYADFSHINDFKTNMDYLSTWYDRLNENAIKGYVTVSAYGGNTCNSEFEFLTGNSMHFLPLGSAVYTNYVDHPIESIVSSLADLGYTTASVIANEPDVWDEGRVHNLLGFEKSYFINDLEFVKFVNNNPSDEDLYNNVERIINERDRTKPLFLFVETMQNHAGYYVDVDEGVRLTETKDILAERYLNILKSSDESLGVFLEDLNRLDERVTVTMFGDHYPHLKSFSEYLYENRNIATLQTNELSLIQQTPFFIWSNKPMESKYIEDISLNYLGIDMFKAAGLPLPKYMQELEKIRNDIPIVSGFGIKGKDGIWYSKGEKNPYEKLLNEYRIVQYYRMFEE